MPKPDGVVLVAFLAGCGASAAGKIPALQGTATDPLSTNQGDTMTKLRQSLCIMYHKVE